MQFILNFPKTNFQIEVNLKFSIIRKVRIGGKGSYRLKAGVSVDGKQPLIQVQQLLCVVDESGLIHAQLC